MLIANLLLTSYQDSLMRAMDVTANNVANIGTTGFKRQEIQFDSLISRPTANDQDIFATERGTIRDASQGPMLTTGNPLDIAIQGAGYFSIQTKDGVRYSRGGAFQVNNQGQVVTATGDALLGDGDQPITVPSDATDLHISPDGVVTLRSGSSTTLTQAGKLKTVDFAQEQDLQPQGNGLYNTTQAATPDTTSRLMQGVVEQSNVEPIHEMTKMIEYQRNYQMAMHMLDLDDKRLNDAINRLSKATA